MENKNDKKRNRRIKITIIIIIIIIILSLIKGCCCSHKENGDKYGFTGDANPVVEYGSVFNSDNIKILKNEKIIDAEPLIDLTKIDYTKLGKYPITIKYVDKDGKVIYEEKRYVEIKDLTPPEIVLKGSNPITIPVGFNYEDAGYVVTDNYDKVEDIVVKKSGSVDTSVPGTYYITYTATDTSGNKSSVTRTIIVEEVKVISENNNMGSNGNNGGNRPPNNPPVIPTPKPIGVTTLELLGTSTVYLDYYADYIEAGFTANDTVDGNITSKVTVSGNVDTNKLGTYTLTYSVTNSGGKTTTVPRTVIVRDTVAPEISLIGDQVTYAQAGITYNDLGVTAMDNYDGDITSNITTSSTVNTSVVGTYGVTYSVCDSSNNCTTETRTVIVKDNALRNAGTSTSQWMGCSIPKANIKTITIKTNLDVPNNVVRTCDVGTTKDSVFLWLDSNDNIVIGAVGTIFTGANASYLFSGFNTLTALNGLENLNTSMATNMTNMFSAARTLTSLDLSTLDTSNVTTMYYMFYGMYAIKTLDLSSFNTSNVTDMSYMFMDMSGLTSLNLSGWDTSNVTNMSSMFKNTTVLTSLDLSSFYTPNLTDTGYMFESMRALTIIDFRNATFDKVTYSNSMFTTSTKTGATIYTKDTTTRAWLQSRYASGNYIIP